LLYRHGTRTWILVVTPAYLNEIDAVPVSDGAYVVQRTLVLARRSVEIVSCIQLDAKHEILWDGLPYAQHDTMQQSQRVVAIHRVFVFPFIGLKNNNKSQNVRKAKGFSTLGDMN
jgi:hypothetical protein